MRSCNTPQCLADWRDDRRLKIERLRWLLNLFLLDGFDRDELDALKREVNAFSAACASSRRKEAA